MLSIAHSGVGFRRFSAQRYRPLLAQPRLIASWSGCPLSGNGDVRRGMPDYWRFSMQLRSEASDELRGSRRVIKNPYGPTYLYAVSSMLLYYLPNLALAAVAARANVES